MAGQSRSCFGSTLDQIRDGLCLDQIELAAQECPLAELAGPSRAGTELQGTLQEKIQDHRTSVPLQLQDILAGKGSGSGKEQGDPLIDGLTIPGTEVG